MTGWCEMPTTTTQLDRTWLNANEARREALFASELQPSDAPIAEMVAHSNHRALQQCGIGGHAGRMAQKSGDHPDLAAKRTRWARRLAAGVAGL
jgi:hypothetical protein